MAITNPLITVKCKNHHEKLINGLWARFLSERGVDIEVEWAGLAVRAHKMVLEMFLSPDKLNRRAELGWHWEEENECLNSLLEFLYRGQVTIRHDQLDNLLEVARESEFQGLVDALVATKKEDKPDHTIKSLGKVLPSEVVVLDEPASDNDNDNDSDYDPQQDLQDRSDCQSYEEEVEATTSQLHDTFEAKKRKLDAAALVSESEAEVTAVAAAVVAANQAAESNAVAIATIPPEFAMLKRPRKKWTLHGDIPEVFQCETCLKTFTRPYHLDRHVRSHANYKPYSCDHCPKTFCDSGNLARHRRIHFKDKPFKCEACDKAFARNEQLNVHSRSCGGASREREYRRRPSGGGAVAVVHEGEEVVIAQVHNYSADNQQFVEANNFDLTNIVFQYDLS